ncbi:hypothetical protein [Paenibacillus polymyxa]|uniref:LysM domain-containing protein n=1 Tax=Paenibacillus polymyxa (strain SC2) TaxID=886882 RepID=E3EKD0_PAEPS|nr:hypothetical protein [Paenibacillus polymyxa]ADO59457.1 hypothetical protein PPSC2_27780 [Paenibacillus polymyxa SC2]WPQ59704.1 hypothetical protein SKN87_29020 [Paenibacillus polymyxa]
MEKAIIYSFESGRRLDFGEKKEPEKKRVRILWNRIILALVLITLLIYGTCSLVADLIDVVPKWINTQLQYSISQDIQNYQQVKVIIQSGDTAWKIQSKLTPNERDIRHPLYLAQSLNPGVQMGDLKAGQIIIFLKEKEIKALTANASH